jgi:AcrR family transcriptional regulator
MARDMERLRRKVLDASILLVKEQGVRAVSFREVARRAGVSHQTPYHHFGNHLGILHAIAKEGFAQLAAAMNEAAAKERDPIAALEAAGVAYVNFARAHVGHFRVMFQSTLVDVHAHDVLPEADEAFGTLVRLTEAAHDAGAGRGLGVTAISQLAWSAVHGLSMLLIEGTLTQKSHVARTEENEVVRQVVGSLSRLLAPHEPKKAKSSRTKRGR